MSLLAGTQRQQLTDTLHFGAREYDPTTGQFLQRDPAEDATGDPYGYAGADPVNHVDPSGLMWGDSLIVDVDKGLANGLSAISDVASTGIAVCTASIVLIPECDLPLAVVAAGSGLAATAIDTTLYETGAGPGGSATSGLCSALSKNIVSAAACAVLKPAVDDLTNQNSNVQRDLVDYRSPVGPHGTTGSGSISSPGGVPGTPDNDPGVPGSSTGPDGKCTYG